MQDNPMSVREHRPGQGHSQTMRPVTLSASSPLRRINPGWRILELELGTRPSAAFRVFRMNSRIRCAKVAQNHG